MRLLQPGARCDEHLHARQVISGNQHTSSPAWRRNPRAGAFGRLGPQLTGWRE